MEKIVVRRRFAFLAVVGGFVLLSSTFDNGVIGAEEPFRTTVYTCGKEGYHTFRIPSLIVTKKATLLAFCEGRKTGRADHGDLDLVVKRSSDKGMTWSDLELLYEEGGDAKITIGNPLPGHRRNDGHDLAGVLP